MDSDENKMEYNQKKGIYEKAIMIKQGFTNYKYVIADSKGKLDEEKMKSMVILPNRKQLQRHYLLPWKTTKDTTVKVIGKGISKLR
jgi:1,4-alpha-glucan branching enzyme